VPPLVYLNGEFLGKDDAKISVYDHGLLYGDGIFEGIRVYDRRIFRLRQHIDRFFDSAKCLLLNIPAAPGELAEIIKETCRRAEMNNGYIRLNLTRGRGDLGLSPFKCPKTSLICIVDQIFLYPKEHYEKGLKIFTATIQRQPPESLNPRVKTLNYLNNILAKIEGAAAGALESLMLSREGFVVEATADNIFIVKSGELYTPPCWLGALRGITRDAVIEIARRHNIPVHEEPFTRYEVYTADECFLTGTAAELVPVATVDNRPIGTGEPGPLYKKLLAEFRQLTATDGELF